MAKAYPKNRKPRPFNDLTGRTFGRWSVLTHLGVNVRRRGQDRMYHCRCECGRERTVYANNLLSGMTTG